MNAKNLPLKFAFLAAIGAVCAGSLYIKGCQQGIDLQGGYSLIFEIRTGKAEISQLEARKAQLQAEFQKAAQQKDAKAQEELKAAIARVEEDIARKDVGLAEGNLSERMIRILKERVDPQGLRSLEWRPVGRDRIEVRMPAGRADTQARREAYRKALEELEAGNIDRGRKRRFLEAPAPRRQELLAEMFPRQQDRMKELAAAHDAEKLAEAALKAAKAGADPERIKKTQADHDEARARSRQADAGVEELNTRVSRLEAILANYRTRDEEDELKKAKTGKAVEILRKQLADDLADLKGRQGPARQGQIDKAVEAYKAWAKVRKHLEDPSDLQRLIAKAGVLEFRIVASVTTPGLAEYGMAISPEQKDYYVNLLRKEGPEEVRRRGGPMAWFPTRPDERRSFTSFIVEEYAGRQYVLLSNHRDYVMLRETGQRQWTLKEAFPDADEAGFPAVGFRFDEAGAKAFYRLTSSHTKKCMAILLDDEAISAPVIQSAISERGVITGRFPREEVDEMVRLLEAGSLPARLNPNPVAVRSFGPTLGAENRKRGVQAAYYGMVTVAAFMLVYYLLAGAIADVALMLNVLLLLGAMSLADAVFTLPGIAGVALTVGMAVDANVLIYERLREEQQRGLAIRMALKAAYERAFSAIFDSNVTTLITCLILAWVGTLEVRGFAITLGLGVAISMFTALVVTRWVFQLLLDAKALARPVRMLSIIGVPQVGWMAKRYWFWGLSGAMMALGIASIFFMGSDIWGIEFSAGTQAVVQFRDDALLRPASDREVLPNDEIVREMFGRKAAELGYEKLRATARVETLIDPAKVDAFLGKYDRSGDGKVSLDEAKAARLNERFFALVDADGDKALDREELRRLPSITYQISTTETDLQRIQEAAREAFGRSLARRTRCDFAPAAAQTIAALGLTTDADGKARVEVVPDSPYRELLEEYVDGVAVVVRDVKPPITEAELRQRIDDLRYEDQTRPTAVIGLGPATEEGFSSFAVLVELEAAPAQWPEAAGKEAELVGAALQREQAMLATSFDAAIAGQTAQRAILAVVLSWIAIIVYLWVRFGSVQWGLAAVVCLIHDVTITVGLVAASGWLHKTLLGQALGVESFQIDLAMVAALLTIIGYSVNDTIVVFDRIRENRGKLTTITAPVINRSINQTLSRTLLTSGTTLIVVLIMYIWGGQGVKAINYALLIGISFGTYSSIAIAAPLLMGFRRAILERAAAAATTA